MKRKAIAMALALSMMATMTPFTGFAASVTDFKDVPSSSWYYDSVKGALDDGFMNGVTNDTFKPAGNLTRAMFVTMLARFDKAAVDNNAASSFTDVKTGQWYTGSVAWAVQNGIVTGYSATKFGTDDTIKREDAALMVYRYANMKNLKLKEKNSPEFNDQAQISSYAKEAMDYCRKYGIFIGDQNNKVYPQKLITRAEAAAVIERLKNIVDESNTPVTPPNNNSGGSSGGGGGTTRYSIVWVTDANGTTQNTTVRRGDKLVPPVTDASMARDGYEFVGWSKTKDDDPANAIATKDLPNASESTTYYPVWKKVETPAADEYVINWNLNYDGAELLQPTKVKKGETPVPPVTPTRDGYDFQGWNTDPTGAGQGITAAAGEATYYAIWKEKEKPPVKHTITWDANGGSWGAETTKETEVNDGEVPAVPETEPTREGWIFIGWNTDRTATTAQNPSVATADATYYAVWAEVPAPEKVYIIWDWNYPGASQTIDEIDKGTKPVPPADSPRTGYTFKGWATSLLATPDQVIKDFPEAAKNIRYYAVWEANEYTITWDQNYDGAPSPEQTTAKYDTQITKPADPTRTGYTFKGWAASKDDAAAGNILTDLPKVTGNATYYAVWEEVEQTTEYNYVIRAELKAKGLTPFLIHPVDGDSSDDDLTRYHVVYDKQGQLIADKSDDIKLVSVAKDLSDGYNIDPIINVLKDASFTYNGVTQQLVADDGKINDIIIDYMPIADNLPADATDQIIESIKNDTTIDQDIRDNIGEEAVESLLTKLDEGITADTELTDEEVAIAKTVSSKIDEYKEDGTLLNKVKENETTANIINQLGLTDADILAMADEYNDALKAALAGRGTGAAEAASLLAAETASPSTKGGIPVKVNPVKAAKEQYDKGLAWFVDNLSKRLVSRGYVSQDRIDQLDLKNSDGIKELYELSDPDLWVTSKDGEYYLKGDGYDYQDQVKTLVDTAEKIRQEYVVGKDASRIAEIIKSKYELAQTKPGGGQLPQVTDETIEKLAEILVMEDPTLEDVEKAGFTDKEYSIARDLTADQAMSAINRVMDRINNDMTSHISEGIKESIAERAAGHYEAKLSIMKEAYAAESAQ